MIVRRQFGRPLFTVVLLSAFAFSSICVLGQSAYLEPQAAEAKLKVAKGLQVKTFACEPNIVSISNMDVDHKGRVWACEAVNYRGNNGKRPAGDRILILEDSDGDGISDKQTVFYQGRDIDIPMGLCVLGNKAIVSVAPEILLLEDTNGDDKADKKTVLFRSDAEFQHDHSLHSFVFGPDGRFYFNFGNTGRNLKDDAGNVLNDVSRRKIQDDGKPYRGGMVFRCDRDFKNIEVLGHNFRNNYEATVDSFANVWQSDNDDDGNLAVRLNYILEGGNYGYLDEITGERWQKKRIGEHKDRWMRHWHQNDPGSVPNVLLTGNGAPTCITVYEGDLLPDIFHNQVIHCDAGPHSVHAFPVERKGAGYQASLVRILKTEDTNFRPIDVAVAPDGSLFVSDWYDSFVGGFKQDDIKRGRIYWLAPQGHRYQPPKYDLESAKGLVEALKSPNYCARYLAWTKLHQMGPAAEAPLKTMLSDKNPRLRARALWLLAQIPGKASTYIRLAVSDSHELVRVVGLRIDQMLNRRSLKLITELAQDKSARVRAECAVQLGNHNHPTSGRVWATLANQHDGKDRWYLEALGIGATNNWDHCLNQWLLTSPNLDEKPAQDIIWRSRAQSTPLLLAKVIARKSAKKQNVDRFVRAFDFQVSASKHRAMELLLFGRIDGGQAQLDPRIGVAIANRLVPEEIRKTRLDTQPMVELLRKAPISEDYLRLVDRFDLRELYPQILAFVQTQKRSDLTRQAVSLLLDKQQTAMLLEALVNADLPKATATLDALAHSLHAGSIDLILYTIKSERFERETLRQAVRGLAAFPSGAKKLMDLAEKKQLDLDLREAVAVKLVNHPRPEIRQRATPLFAVSAAKDDQPVPGIPDLVKLRGNPDNGKHVFQNHGKCASCHIAEGQGKMVGPELTKIGEKLGRSALFESILYPSAAINHNYQTMILQLDSGLTVSGLLLNQNKNEITLKLEDATTNTFKRSEIEEATNSNLSIMPADLHKLMTVQELSDVVAYLTTLK